MSQDSHGSITLANTTEEKVPKTIDESNEGSLREFFARKFFTVKLILIFLGEESLKVDIMEYLMDAFITVVSFITRTSYIGTNIIMMVHCTVSQ